MEARYLPDQLISVATSLLERSGLDLDKSKTVAEILVEGDLLGHSTHGLQLLAPYLNELERGAMTKTGAPRVIADLPGAVTWDGMRLPGPWLVARAIDLALQRAKINGTCIVVVRRSHHIACLAAYLKRVTDQGMMVLLTCSAPAERFVAPHGGARSVFTPNPIAAAWPTDGDPVILDVSLSIASVGVTRRLSEQGRQMPGPWLIDAQGNPSSDPGVLFADPPGAILPVGGLDHGHKGYALALLVEALTGGLSGHGRADPNEGWSADVFLQVYDPALFAGTDQFIRQTSWLAEACHKTPPRPGFDGVRLPGEAALRRREEQLKLGIELYPSIFPALIPWATKFNVPMPETLK